MNLSFSVKTLVKRIILFVVEAIDSFLGESYPSISLLQVSATEKIKLSFYLLLRRKDLGGFRAKKSQICFYIYSTACERMLLPALEGLLASKSASEKHLDVVVIHNGRLSSQQQSQLKAKGCRVASDHGSIVEYCFTPLNKLVVLCLDHRNTYKFHKRGVDLADMLREFSVKTISIQHGGNTEYSLWAMSSFASDRLMIWGEHTYKILLRQYNIHPERLVITGNPLHDKIKDIRKNEVYEKMSKNRNSFRQDVEGKRIISFFPVLHTEYDDRENPEELYRNYLQHVINSVNFDAVILIIKIHPTDELEKYMSYLSTIEKYLENRESIFLLSSSETSVDSLDLIHVSNLVISRASTVNEEALLLGKRVIAFDLDCQGPSKGFSYLLKYSNYSVAYSLPKSALSEEIELAISDNPSRKLQCSLNFEKDFAFALDGQSTNRVVETLLQQLKSSELILSPVHANE